MINNIQPDGRCQLEEAIKTHGIRGLARLMGITPAYLSMIASGKRALTPKMLINQWRPW